MRKIFSIITTIFVLLLTLVSCENLDTKITLPVLQRGDISLEVGTSREFCEEVFGNPISTETYRELDKLIPKSKIQTALFCTYENDVIIIYHENKAIQYYMSGTENSDWYIKNIPKLGDLSIGDPFDLANENLIKGYYIFENENYSFLEYSEYEKKYRESENNYSTYAKDESLVYFIDINSDEIITSIRFGTITGAVVLS